eukprot:scaffold68291_cov74-Attheya_sp.AAC.1
MAARILGYSNDWRCIHARPLVLDPWVPAYSRCLSGIAVRQASMSGVFMGSLVCAGHDAAVSELVQGLVRGWLFKTHRKPSLSIDSGAMPSKVKHLGATDCNNETKYHKNRGKDADAKKKTSKTDDTFGNGKSSKMKKCGSTGNIVVMSAMSLASSTKAGVYPPRGGAEFQWAR